MKFLLDTDICIHALRGHAHVIQRLLAARRVDVCVSVITEAELRTGAAKSASPLKTLHAVEKFLAPIEIVPFESDDAHTYGLLRAKLERAGKPVGPLDTLIAAQAVARKCVLVTNNEREFSRIGGLRIDNWYRS